jgi:hypothetical protein
MQKELSIIMDLMKKLQEKMQYGEEDFAERLGRKKAPEAVEIAKVSIGESKLPGMEGDMEGGLEEEEDMLEEDESPEAKLKNRILKLRG